MQRLLISLGEGRTFDLRVYTHKPRNLLPSERPLENDLKQLTELAKRACAS